MSLDLTDRKLLNLVQSDFPFDQEPFVALGSKLAVSEDDVIRRVRHLKEKNIIRSIAGVFNAVSLGYHSTLVAMHLDEAYVDDAAALINRYPGVSHNYLRDHYLNLWFTLTTTGDTDLSTTVAKLGGEAKAELTLSLQARRAFKINACFDMLGHEDTPDNGDVIHLQLEEGDEITDDDILLVRELQHDLPMEAQPFNAMADNLGLEISEFLHKALSLKERGIMRRYGARLDHRRAGFVANAMSCWLVAPDKTAWVGKILASQRKVSHCYERYTAPEWPYNLYAMIHGHTEEEYRSLACQLSEETEIADYVLLNSTKEYLKRRVKYFMS